MNTTINQTGYPIFTPNQVLKNNDLNQVVEYLDSQNYLTRTHLIGMGIIAGMEVSSSYTQEVTKVKAKISVSPGCGITSEGYVISFDSKIQLTHYQDVKVSSSLFTRENLIAAIQPLTSEVIELFPEAGNQRIILHKNPDGTQRDVQKFQEFISDRVLVVLCEIEDLHNEFCFFEYDESSRYRNFRWRFFLLPRTQNPDSSQAQQLSADTLLKTAYQIPEQPWQGLTVENIFNARNHFLQEFDRTTKKFQNFAPQVERFGYVKAKKSVDLSAINHYQAFWDNYYQICTHAIAAIDRSFPKLFWLFSPFFHAFQPNSGRDFNQLQQRLQTRLEAFRRQETTSTSEQIKPPEPPYGIQYFYDYLSQLVAAFYELAETVFDLMDDYPPETRRFPKYLMLGLVPPPSPVTTEPNQGLILTSPYRSYFTQPPIYNSNQVRLQRVRHLYERLLKLSAKDSFDLLPFYITPLKITPSLDRSAPLSKQAIPYYLNYPNLYKYWNYDAYRKGISDRHPAYFYPKRNPEENFHEFQDLNYRLDNYNFYRIEGHIGKGNDQVFKNLRDYQQRYNLAFDVITLKLGNRASLEDLNISGQFADLEADFRRIKGAFQKLWTQHEHEWSRNVFLQTLKQSFFDKSDLKDMDSGQLSNFILERAGKPEAYEFVKVENTEQQFQIYIRDENNIRIARYVTQIADTRGNSLSDFRNLIIDFAEISLDEIDQEKQRIIKEIAFSISSPEVTYDLVIDPASNPEKYHLKFSTDDTIVLPSVNLSYSPILVSLSHFAVGQQNNQPIIPQKEFQDFETLYSLLRDSSLVYGPTTLAQNNPQSYLMGDKQVAEELNDLNLTELIKTYQLRLEQLKKLHLFPNFAQQHPGMEHLGGVTKGGTFVLVYVDGKEVDELLVGDRDPAIHQLRSVHTEAIRKFVALPEDLYTENIGNWKRLFEELEKRKDIVIADFCLPYRCSSDAPAVSYVLARSRPIILLEKTNLVFCEGDQRRYEFILEPEGGTVRGEGIVFAGSKQFFQPSSIDPGSREDLARGLEVAITFTYAVDDTYDTLTVTIYPLPRPNLSVSDGQSFCHNAAPVEIKLANGTPDNLQLIQVKINDVETNILNPRGYATEGETETVIITALIRNQTTECENTLTHTITIYPLPQADLSVRDGQTFCNNADSLNITLADDTPENIELIQVKINDVETNLLNPREYATKGETETVTITALIRNQTTECENTLTRIITIYPLPQADFQLEIDNINSNGFSIRVYDIQPTGENSFTFHWEHDGISNPINPGNNNFIISYASDSHHWVADAVVSITLRVQAPPELGNCISEPVTKTIPIPIGGVQGLQLLTISNNQIINTLTLESDSNFNISDFHPNNEYAIAALTIPPLVGSVVFEYTPPNANSEVIPAINPPYILPNWQPTVGMHRITAQTTREINSDRIEGNTTTVTIHIHDDSNSEPELTPNQPTPRSLKLPNQLRFFLPPSDEEIAQFKPIIQQEKIQSSQILTLYQPHIDRWRQTNTTKEKNLMFSLLTRQNYRNQILALGAATLLLIMGWTYTLSRQTQTPQNPEPQSNLRF
ncbi:hypothetical protein [Calothrix sp. NIES-3974]|uniref:hypothetical protein n=1 Tax=Calothrix sp. NIES-3974 TaxID=2005462 RepID=UPI000B613B93|nr:hypothetical protein [Calothrix sp. NIES-3974]BAZ03822.1 hypothetical protein NIES3974_04520 [Calothrix sp. NIES-3974]